MQAEVLSIEKSTHMELKLVHLVTVNKWNLQSSSSDL